MHHLVSNTTKLRIEWVALLFLGNKIQVHLYDLSYLQMDWKNTNRKKHMIETFLTEMSGQLKFNGILRSRLEVRHQNGIKIVLYALSIK